MSHASTRTTFLAYITKYALTKGIQCVLVLDNFDISIRMVSDTARGGGIYHLPDWHRSPVQAIVRAEQMRDAAIQSTQSKIERLRRMTFAVPKAEVPDVAP